MVVGSIPGSNDPRIYYVYKGIKEYVGEMRLCIRRDSRRLGTSSRRTLKKHRTSSMEDDRQVQGFLFCLALSCSVFFFARDRGKLRKGGSFSSWFPTERHRHIKENNKCFAKTGKGLVSRGVEHVREEF